jgi:hypothetical protein
MAPPVKLLLAYRLKLPPPPSAIAVPAYVFPYAFTPPPGALMDEMNAFCEFVVCCSRWI